MQNSAQFYFALYQHQPMWARMDHGWISNKLFFLFRFPTSDLIDGRYDIFRSNDRTWKIRFYITGFMSEDRLVYVENLGQCKYKYQLAEEVLCKWKRKDKWNTHSVLALHSNLNFIEPNVWFKFSTCISFVEHLISFYRVESSNSPTILLLLLLLLPTQSD